ncbi:glutamate racemase [Moraxella sp. Tifton1]|uniref:glutamate racemase n=1 Tax=Moraxella oculi TaxID=2940516 RepID=UPI002013AFE6|nr:glutamate racemase [Moraxella sp. Tifton1]MCL1623088.1 glutamate racemase [Moraxella sp. Tifton1]
MINQNPTFINDVQNAPIGVFDSGVGGLSVYQHLKQGLPNERFIYYADTANVPYGNKSGDEILLPTLQAVSHLCQLGCKLIVIACNSASAHALPAVRQQCGVPVVGLVPAVKPACAITKRKKIGVLATQATLQGELLNEVIESVCVPAGIEVFKHFEPCLVPWVESGMSIHSPVATLLTDQVKRWADEGVDVIVLGCTHYPFFKQFLQDHIHKNNLDVRLLDSGVAIAERVKSLLLAYQIEATTPNDAALVFYASRFNEQLTTLVTTLIHESPCFTVPNFLD